MKIHSTDHYLAIGTHARSMYKLDLTTIVGIDEDIADSENSTIQLNQNYPNPFSGETTISFVLSEDGNTKIEILDIRGSLVASLLNGHLSAGKHNVNWDGCNHNGIRLPEAYYLIKLQSGNSVKTQKMMLIN
ncbi:MAG: T9SS type A sorting domain-containing protein [Bacteroidetes bacterium]|nr:T9SS type A sorting domain-containing protein [Bacteroidota bacterium]